MLADGRSHHGQRGVICSVSPEQLYRGLLAGTALPSDIDDGLGRYRYGKGNMQIHYALSQPPRWRGGPDLDKVALLHLTPGLDGVSQGRQRGRARRAAVRAHDLRRAADGPRPVAGTGRAGRALAATARSAADHQGRRRGRDRSPGRWTLDRAVRDAYADRVEAILARHIDGFADSIVARRAYSPADLEALNVNLVGGDPYGGYCGVDQFFLWRPFKGTVNHRTPVPNLYHIGAATHPGPGLGGGSGFLLAKSLA